MKELRKFIPALLVAVGLLALGLCIQSGLNSISANKRTVAVRGLAEREVMADRVTWPIVYKLVGNDLPRLYDQISENNSKITCFLLDNGIAQEEISITAPGIYDQQAERYSQKENVYRYIVTGEVIVTSDKIEKVNDLIMRQAELMKVGISLSNEDYQYQTKYEFLGLNEIKPEMIEEATHNARQAANKFAEDSQSKLGKIINATQGQFTINDRDNYTPWIKEVRVVTYIDFALDD